jgi:hypothetical protein
MIAALGQSFKDPEENEQGESFGESVANNVGVGVKIGSQEG